MLSALHGKCLILSLLVLLVAVRLVCLSATELLPEEAYYWDYTQHPALSYLDHPPMVAWLIKLGTLVFGHHAFGVRIGSVCCGAIATFFCFCLTQKLYGTRAALVAVLLMQALPIFFLSSLVITPDAPLIACWAAALYFLHAALVEGKTSAFFGVGSAFGLGLLSKYTMALLALAALGYVVADRRARRWLWHPAPYLAVVGALVIFSPVLLWNARHDWASFAFQSAHRMAGTPHFSTHFLLGSMLVLLSPVGLLAAARALVSKVQTDYRSRLFFQVSALVPLAVFAIFSLRHRPQLNWTGPLWLAVVPAMAAGILQSGDGLRQKMMKAAWVATFGILSLLYVGMLWYLAVGFPGVRYSSRTELLPVGWTELGREISDIEERSRDELGADHLLFGADKNAIASELAFYHRRPADAATRAVGGHLFGGKGLMYEFWFPQSAQEGKNLLMVGFEAEDLSRASVRGHLEDWGPIHEARLMRDGKFIRPYFYRIGFRYHAARGPSGATSLP